MVVAAAVGIAGAVVIAGAGVAGPAAALAAESSEPQPELEPAPPPAPPSTAEAPLPGLALPSRLTRVAVLPMGTDPLAVSASQAIAARLIQTGRYLPVTGGALQAVLRTLRLRVDPGQLAAEGERSEAFFPQPALLELMKALLEQERADQVIVGRVIREKDGVMVVVHRYGLEDTGRPQLKGVGVIAGTKSVDPKADDVFDQMDNLMAQLYPPPEEVVRLPVERLVVLPTTLRLRIGGHQRLTVLAFDAQGRRIEDLVLLYSSSDESRVQVSADGTVTALAPGQATIQVQALGRRALQSASANVSVMSPVLGVRAGLEATRMQGGQRAEMFGLRLIPSVEPQLRSTQGTDLSRALDNPVSALTGFITSVLGNGLMTLEMEVRPERDFTLALDGVQRSVMGYFGTGIGVSLPLTPSGTTGLLVRITAGLQWSPVPDARWTIPLELTGDMVFYGGETSRNEPRLTLATGLDLYP